MWGLRDLQRVVPMMDTQDKSVSLKYEASSEPLHINSETQTLKPDDTFEAAAQILDLAADLFYMIISSCMQAQVPTSSSLLLSSLELNDAQSL